ncbi:MAG: trans-sulfuration enzyme family protein [Candidatus Hodarchaeales archaeon]
MSYNLKYSWKDSTIALHAGEETKYADSHTTPIFATSTFSFPNAEIGRLRFSGEESGYIYTRLGNPTVEASEKKIAALEGINLIKNGKHIEGHAFSTGMACIATAIISLTKSGDTVLATNPVYGGTNYLLNGILKPYGVETKFIKTSGDEGVENVSNALNPDVKVLFIESPANPSLCISDITEISKIGQENDIPVLVDNTFATPILQRPLEMGASVVLHSTTKYLNGHGTTCSGILASRLTGELANQLRFIKKNLGGTQSPFDAFLVTCGMKTLPIRMERHCENALILAEFLEDHQKIDYVNYPGLQSHPDHELAKKQMSGKYGGIVSFELKGGLNAGKSLMNNVDVFTLAVSLGTIDSLIQHPASMTHASVPKEIRLEGGISDGLVRISVGLEDIEDLIEDFSSALTKI